MEATKKRNEASMKRKHAQLKVTPTLADGSSAPPSPSSTGAMDSLLEKLRAAAPQTRDTRDRRRRARLQNRHQVRVASGQHIPDADEIPEVEVSLKSPESVSTEGILSPIASTKDGDEDDIAERAALLLQGMRGTEGGEDEDAERRDSVRRARRRDNAEEERKARRRRRDKASVSEALPEGEESQIADAPAQDETKGNVPATVVVSPPSPEGSKTKPIELDDD